MGYGTTQKGYKLYYLRNKVFFISTDVVFNESIFPFQTYFIDDIQDIVLLDESQASALTIRPVGLDYIDDPIDTTRHSFDIDLRGHLPIPNLLMRNKCLSSEKQQSTRTSRPPLWQ